MSSQTDRLTAALTGRYRIDRELGAGGMATVYLADDLKHDRKVALKVLKVSPDRTLAAMTTGEGAGSDIWIRDYPVPQGTWRVSANEPSGSARWSPDGSHLYYWRGSSAAPDTLYRARVERRPSVVVHPGDVVTAIDLSSTENWDIHPDGKRIVVTVDDVSRSATSSASRETSRYVIVQNWFTDHKRLTSRKKQ